MEGMTEAVDYGSLLLRALLKCLELAADKKAVLAPMILEG